MSQAGIIDVIASNPSIPIQITTDSGVVTPAANNVFILGGTGISTSGSGDTVTIASSSSGFTWSEVTGTTQAISTSNGYVANNASLVTFTLPLTASIGEGFQIVGKGAGLYKIEQNAGQTIYFISSGTTTGTGGSLTAVEQYASIEVVCITENDDWAVIDSAGNFTIV